MDATLHYRLRGVGAVFTGDDVDFHRRCLYFVMEKNSRGGMGQSLSYIVHGNNEICGVFRKEQKEPPRPGSFVSNKLIFNRFAYYTLAEKTFYGYGGNSCSRDIAAESVYNFFLLYF